MGRRIGNELVCGDKGGGASTETQGREEDRTFSETVSRGIFKVVSDGMEGGDIVCAEGRGIEVESAARRGTRLLERRVRVPTQTGMSSDTLAYERNISIDHGRKQSIQILTIDDFGATITSSMTGATGTGTGHVFLLAIDFCNG